MMLFPALRHQWCWAVVSKEGLAQGPYELKVPMSSRSLWVYTVWVERVEPKLSDSQVMCSIHSATTDLNWFSHWILTSFIIIHRLVLKWICRDLSLLLCSNCKGGDTLLMPDAQSCLVLGSAVLLFQLRVLVNTVFINWFQFHCLLHFTDCNPQFIIIIMIIIAMIIIIIIMIIILMIIKIIIIMIITIIIQKQQLMHLCAKLPCNRSCQLIIIF